MPAVPHRIRNKVLQGQRELIQKDYQKALRKGGLVFDGERSFKNWYE